VSAVLIGTPDRVAAILFGAALLVFLAWFFFGTKGSTAFSAAGSEVTIVVEGGYDPDIIVAKRGVPLTLVFDRREESTCSDEVVLPEFGIRRFLPAHAKTPVQIVPSRAGEFPFACGMNMLHGTIRVVD
jgi:Cu+-exporting ATPase